MFKVTQAYFRFFITYMIYTHLTLPINDLKYYYMFNYSDSFKK